MVKVAETGPPEVGLKVMVADKTEPVMFNAGLNVPLPVPRGAPHPVLATVAVNTGDGFPFEVAVITGVGLLEQFTTFS